jgi:NCAIR mutase (PurE)-related protein
LLTSVKAGELSIDKAIVQLGNLPYEEVGFAKLDHHRNLRRGFPEVVFSQGKTVEQITTITQKLAASTEKVLVTRASSEVFNAVSAIVREATYNTSAKTIIINRSKTPKHKGIAIVSAGTSDIPVAEEAAVTAEIMDNNVDRIYDVGVAGIHRLFDHMPRIRDAKVIIVIAGMDGALPSVVSGLVAAPVIAVPTSNGYGASFQGVAPLLTMLNSCSPGIAVVNIDNGFGAGYIAALINKAIQDAGKIIKT